MMSPNVIKMFEAEDDRTGKIRLEWWPEGFVLWAGGDRMESSGRPPSPPQTAKKKRAIEVLGEGLAALPDFGN